MLLIPAICFVRFVLSDSAESHKACALKKSGTLETRWWRLETLTLHMRHGQYVIVFFLDAAPALLSNWARSPCLKTAADILIGNLFSDIRALTVYTPYFISSFLFSFPKDESYHSSSSIPALDPSVLLNHVQNLSHCTSGSPLSHLSSSSSLSFSYQLFLALLLSITMHKGTLGLYV